MTTLHPAITPSTMRFKNILIPTDFSEAAWQATEYAMSIASPGYTRLIFAHVLNEAPINPAIIPDRYVKELQAERIKMVRRQLQVYEDYCERTQGGCITHKSMVMPGRAASKILLMAQNENVDLIVLGSAAASRLMESVSLEVIDKAQCPVLSLPHKSHSPQFSQLIFLPRSTSHSQKALQYVKQLSTEYHLDLHISPLSLDMPQSLPRLRLSSPEALLAIMLDSDPATRLQQKRWIQTLIRDEHKPLFIFQSPSKQQNEK
ncbi:MAG: universal stress protein, partial [Bacteroidota bacterium]